MLHPEAPYEFDTCTLHCDLTDESSTGRGGPFRHEFFFLPGATAEEFHAHYLGEMKARGTIWRQIRKVNRAINLKKQESGITTSGTKAMQLIFDSDYDQESTGNSQLPGFVWPKNDRNCDYVSYRGWFFMYHDADTDCQGDKSEKRAISLVTFDHIPMLRAEDKAPESDPMERPIYSRPIPVKHKYVELSLGGWMESRVRKHWEDESNEATCEARKPGWTSW
ncbi:hypothetical protein F53441_8706 [Fusarium austroafricanum]|uniref:Uncharacterized protein n=1 Tax=Fusarium austroafricanum TaxID=2364996 RepID=A0A8H4KAR9_9HYPO|nr:hypothetical protein F53441_8706 [Fusarium austroafricanum]